MDITIRNIKSVAFLHFVSLSIKHEFVEIKTPFQKET